ncbi:MAG TPA: hypothetical protein VIR58_08485 [Acidimicrobiales bacterium]
MSDAQDQAESLDDDKTSAEYPPDEPWGVDEPEVTQEGEWAQESFEERTERMAEPDPDDGRPVVQPYVDPSQDIVDDEAQAVAEAEPASPDEDDLVAAAESGDRTASLTGEDVPAPAEEAALHIEEG